MIANALSVDVEEYYHAIIFAEAVGTRRQLESRVETSVERVLALLAAHDVHGTFFTLGEVAAAHPAVVRKIAAAEHEIACHGHCHELVSRQTPKEFRTDVRTAKALLEDITGEPVLGYRAPNFSIGRAETWAYDILLEEGFRYDSSVYPIRHDRYGDPSASRFAYDVRRDGRAGLREFPIGTIRLCGANLPIGGGGYFRLLPAALVRRGIEYVNHRERRPIVFYFHPWELDPGQPRPPMAWRHRFRHYVGLARHEAKLDRLLRAVRFATIRAVFEIP